MKTVPFLRPNVVPVEAYVHYLKQIDESKIYTNYGPLNEQLEKRILYSFFSGEGAVTTVNNATAGLMTAIETRKRKGGKYAIMPSFTFSATPLAAMWCGLEPYFVDINPNDWALCTSSLKMAVEQFGDEVAIVIPYATFGSWMDLAIYEELEQKGIPVVVDAAPGFGLQKEEQQYGKGFSGMIVFSFHATKPFGIGEGGLLYSVNSEYIKTARMLTNFGFSSERETIVKGLNAKMSEYAAAIALATLDVLPEKIEMRRQIVESYEKFLEEHGLFQQGWELQQGSPLPYQFMPILCPKGKSNKLVIEQLERNGVEARAYFSPPCHRQPLFQEYQHSNLRCTEQLADRVVSLPLWEGMKDEVINYVICSLKESVMVL